MVLNFSRNDLGDDMPNLKFHQETEIDDLVDDVLELIFQRIPLSSLRSVRLTCKKWRNLSYRTIVGKSVPRDSQNLRFGFTLMGSRICWYKFNFGGIRKNVDEYEDLSQISIKEVDVLKTSQVSAQVSAAHHCNGILFCVSLEYPILVAWNPYLGILRHIDYIPPRDGWMKFAIGYDGSHKILKICRDFCPYSLFDFAKRNWSELEITHDWTMDGSQEAVTVRGNAYFYVYLKDEGTQVMKDFVVCFDFTAKRFGELLNLPLNSSGWNLKLSSFREDQLTYLLQNDLQDTVEVWISQNIDSTQIVWTRVFRVKLPEVLCYTQCFLTDEEKKMALLFDVEAFFNIMRIQVVGEEGYWRPLVLGEHQHQLPSYCFDYVPSLCQMPPL